jgi:hypothetical protein
MAALFVQVSFLAQFEKCFAALFELIAGLFDASAFLQLSNRQGRIGCRLFEFVRFGIVFL